MDISSTDVFSAASAFGYSHGSVAVVSGAATGVGWAAASQLADAGVTTYGLIRDLHDADGLESSRVQWIAADVSVREDVARSFAQISSTNDHVDLVVSNAAIARHGDVGSMSHEDLAAMMETNVYGFFNMVQAALPLMIAGSSSIVAVSSVHANVTAPMVSGYAATKGALVSAIRAVALDLGSRGVRVNAVLPGSVDTPMLRASAASRSPDDPEAAIRKWGESHPIGRVLQPREIADVILFLGSRFATGITGSTITVDGGLSAKLAL
ncbi:SDR family NAD(P)-dependent oxidoreductase [Gemmatimonas sp.]|uniref:SDR family NAD(P)-dependent oxidoreductase n=1 Tax=Gemmatimonas sp. TaxID=1962908 RepID=UPI0035682BD8